MIVVDGLRADRVGLQGYERPITPEIDAFAADGIVYARATSPATWCVPAHASLLTGRWPSYHGAERSLGQDRRRVQAIAADAGTLAELLGASGFRTAAFVANDEHLRAEYGFARGFADFDSDAALASGTALADAVARWLAEHPERSFVLVNVDHPRHPDGEPAAKAGASGDAATRRAALADRYDRDVASADRAVGDVLDVLRRAGRYERALVVVTSDHGELLGEHGLDGAARPPFEPVVHVPLVVKYPNAARAGEWIDRRVSTLSVFATVLGAAGIRVPEDAQARSLDELHPVWVEEVDASGVRLRAGYDGADVKMMSLASADGDVACLFQLGMDPGELRPDCGAGARTPLGVALASFSRRGRPLRPASALGAQAIPSPGPDVARAH
ncbi:MAG TPA: sulfatase [Candidatus Binatia bacterium]|nr:sulfatase [Candidatus Binatia bacterium]